jgi:hypothetical protein
MRERRLDAARHRQHGLHVLTFEQLAARLAGGLTCSVDEETLRHAVQAVLPTLSLGELDNLKSLPGMVAAAVDTIRGNRTRRPETPAGGLCEIKGLPQRQSTS